MRICLKPTTDAAIRQLSLSVKVKTPHRFIQYIRDTIVLSSNEAYESLREMGCELYQGYYFAKPMPEEDFERFLSGSSAE